MKDSPVMALILEKMKKGPKEPEEMEENETEDEMEDIDGGKEGRMAAAEEMIQAAGIGDAASFAEALKNFIELC